MAPICCCRQGGFAHKLSVEPLHGDIPAERSRHLCRRGDRQSLRSDTDAGKNAVEGGRLLYTFECKNLAPHGTFVVGNLQLNPKQAEGINVAVYAPRASSANAEEFCDSVARSTIIFSDMLDPYRIQLSR